MRNTETSSASDYAAHRPTRPQLAAVFGVSSRWIGELRAAGNLPPDGATLAENVAAWVRYRATLLSGDIEVGSEDGAIIARGWLKSFKPSGAPDV